MLRPTWRSHLGAAMSAIIPGTGQFLQKSEQWLGGVFLATWSFLVAGGLLAMFAPGNQTQSVRTGMAAGFLGVAGGFNVLAAVHAHQAGRERTRQVQRAEATTGVGGLTHRPIGE